MKNKVLVGIIAVFSIAAVVGYNVHISQNSNVKLSDLVLTNIEALASTNEIGSGDPCYSDGKYDIDKPEVVQCGTPCKYEHLKLPWFPSTSNCPYN